MFARTSCIALVLAAVFATPATSQGVVGVGVGLQSAVIESSEFGPFAYLAPEFYVPINAVENLLIEPSLGFFRASQEDDEGFSSSATIARVAVGVMFARSAGSEGRVYVGPRVGALFLSAESSGGGFDQSSSRTDLLVGLLAGGEYILVPGLTLGAEAGLEWVRLGTEEMEPDPTPVIDESASLLRTVGVVKVRWYLP